MTAPRARFERDDRAFVAGQRGVGDLLGAADRSVVTTLSPSGCLPWSWSRIACRFVRALAVQRRVAEPLQAGAAAGSMIVVADRVGEQSEPVG